MSLQNIPTQSVLPLINTVTFSKSADVAPLAGRAGRSHSHLHDDPVTCPVPFIDNDLNSLRFKRMCYLELVFKPLAIKPFRSIQRRENQIIYSDSYGVKKTNWFPSNVLKMKMNPIRHFGFHVHTIRTRISDYQVSLSSFNHTFAYLSKRSFH